MTPINKINIRPMSGKTYREAVNHAGWTRNVMWPVRVLGAYGNNESTDDDLDAYVYTETGVRPGEILRDNDGIQMILSACAGRDRAGRPLIRLSLHRA